ncbi:hypothetical protein OHB53_00750 [Streptomyces sp. NBC_00056]|uniref:hypothetical protein n=1 Tax=Streptomyces sp. NBC_00056 TaxID=2975633 RepID=UPI0032521F47
MHLPRPPRRRSAAWAAAAVTATALAAGVMPAVAADTPSTAAKAKIDASLSSAVAKGGDATFFVLLKAQADLSGTKKQKTHAAKAKAAFKELRA